MHRNGSTPHAPTPPLVAETKELMDRGARLADDRPSRRWFCRSCGEIRDGAVIPHGWYSVARHVGEPGEKPMRLGTYCSAWCLDAQMPRLIGVEADAGDRWHLSPYRQRRTEGGR